MELTIKESDRRKIERAAEEKAALKLLRMIKRKAPVDRGRLRSSYEYQAASGGSDTRIVSTAPHASSLEYGTMPFTPPLTPLKEWGSRVLGSSKAGAAVWAKIRREGISPQPHVRPAIDELKRRYS